MKTKLMARELCWKHLGMNTSFKHGGREYNGVIVSITQMHQVTSPIIIHVDGPNGVTAYLTCGHEITLWEEQ